MKECQNGGGSSDLFFTLRMSTLVTSKSKNEHFGDIKVKGLACTGKLQPSGSQLHSGKKMAGHLLLRCLGMLEL